MNAFSGQHCTTRALIGTPSTAATSDSFPRLSGIDAPCSSGPRKIAATTPRIDIADQAMVAVRGSARETDSPAREFRGHSTKLARVEYHLCALL